MHIYNASTARNIFPVVNGRITFVNCAHNFWTLRISVRILFCVVRSQTVYLSLQCMLLPIKFTPTRGNLDMKEYIAWPSKYKQYSGTKTNIHELCSLPTAGTDSTIVQESSKTT